MSAVYDRTAVRSATYSPDGLVKGITRPITATGTATEPTEDAFGGTRFAIELSAELDRRDFGLTHSANLPNGKLALDYPVTLEVVLELVRREG